MSEQEKPAGWDHLFQQGAFPPRYKTFAEPNQSVVDWAKTLPVPAHILDVGCGVGRHTLYLARLGHRLAGTDIAPAGVKQTQVVCAEAQVPFEGKVADMTALPWEANTFDAVLSTATLAHHRLADIRIAIAEIFRVLKPHGVILLDFLHRGTQAYQEVQDQVRSGVLTEIEPNTFMDARPEVDLLDDAFLPHHYSDEAEVQLLLSAFESVQVWAELSPLNGQETLPRRGYWVATARKP